MQYSIGIDIGSTSSELVLMDENKNILHMEKLLSGGNIRKTGKTLLDNCLKQNSLKTEDIGSIIGTGYGRKNLDFITGEKTEITCYAKGAFFANEKARTIIDIGGQDSKVISINEKGKVGQFMMNDKCAAGTGKFLEMICRRFEVKLDDMGPLSLTADKDIDISSICAVFAESETISLVSEGEELRNVFQGAHRALCDRVVGMANRIDIKDEIIFCGGVSKNTGMVDQMSKALGQEVVVPENAEFLGAIGASIIGLSLL